MIDRLVLFAPSVTVIVFCPKSAWFALLPLSNVTGGATGDSVM